MADFGDAWWMQLIRAKVPGADRGHVHGHIHVGGHARIHAHS